MRLVSEANHQSDGDDVCASAFVGGEAWEGWSSQQRWGAGEGKFVAAAAGRQGRPEGWSLPDLRSEGEGEGPRAGSEEGVAAACTERERERERGR